MLYLEYSQKFLQKKLKLNYQNKKIIKKDILSKLNDKIVKSLDFISYLEFLLGKSDEDTRKFVSELINDIEDISVEIISGIENIPIVGNIAQSTIEGIKAFANAGKLPFNIINEIINNVADPKKYKEINNVKDFVEDSFNFIEGIGDGIQTTTVETIKDIGHGIKDTLRPLTGDNVVLEGIEEGFNEVANKANDCFNFFGNIFNDIRNAFVR